MDFLSTIEFGKYFIPILSFWWVYVPFILYFLFTELWKDYINNKYINSIRWVLLEVKVTINADIGPKVFENIFSGLHGTLKPIDAKDRFFKGEIPPYFSLEIVGDGGDIKFYVRLPEDTRNFVESLIFSQYPEAEITEAEDYVNKYPDDVPNSKYDIFSAEFKLVKKDIYPIKTYAEFGGEDSAIDPLASFSEVFSRLRSGEQIWLQFIVQPTGAEVGDNWTKEAEDVISELAGRKKAKKPNSDWGVKIVDIIDKAITNTPVKEKKEEKQEIMRLMTPLEDASAKAITRSITKLGFRSGIRFLYIADKEIFSRSHIGGVVGSFKQFASQHLNSFKPGYKTTSKGWLHQIFPSDEGFFIANQVYKKKVKLYKAARNRSLPIEKAYILNTEELATLYHFPSKPSPGLPKVESRRGDSPASLPIK